MNKYDRKAFKLEKFIHARLPLKARIKEELRANDDNLVDHILKNEIKEFDGVVYYPKTKEVYCSFYDTKRKMAVLIPAIELIYENKKVQKQINKFIKSTK